jgi:hypothetical protein
LRAMEAFLLHAMGKLSTARQEAAAMVAKGQVCYPWLLHACVVLTRGVVRGTRTTPISVFALSATDATLACGLVQFLTDYAVKELEKDARWAATALVRAAGGKVCYVKVLYTSDNPWRKVDFNTKTCGCLWWQMNRRPCAHAVAAYNQKVSTPVVAH